METSVSPAGLSVTVVSLIYFMFSEKRDCESLGAEVQVRWACLQDAHRQLDRNLAWLGLDGALVVLFFVDVPFKGDGNAT